MTPRWLLPAVLLTAAVGLAWRTPGIALAAMEAKPLQDGVVAAATRPRDFSAERLRALVAEAAALRDRDPADGQWQELHGRAALLAAAHPKTPVLEAVRLNEAAVASFRNAVRLRPDWPYGHDGLVLAKSAAGQFDDEWRDAIAAALRLGPNERRIREDLGMLRLIHGSRLAEPLRGQLETLLPRLMLVYGGRWVDIADRHDEAEWLCALASLPHEARERCTTLGWLSPAPAPR